MVLLPNNDKDFCTLYKKLQELFGKHNLSMKKRNWAVESTVVAMEYVSGLAGDPVAEFKLTKVVEENRLFNLELTYIGGGLVVSETLKSFEKFFLVQKNISKSKNGKVKSKIHSTTS